MRRVLGTEIAMLAAQDQDIVLLVGDIGYRVFDLFREKFPRSTEETEIDRLEPPGYNIYTLFEFIHF